MEQSDEKTAILAELKAMRAKLDLVRNYMVVAWDGLRNQQSAANDEVVQTIRGIDRRITEILRELEK